MYSIILAWWTWTRLRPLSTDDLPKQFLSIYDEKSLIQNTAERLLEIDSKPENIFVSTNSRYEKNVLEQLKNYWIQNLIVEPVKRNTAPAIAFIVKYLEDIAKTKSDSVVLVCPSDHFINPTDRFVAYMEEANKLAQKWNIVLFGIQPDVPETWYGYIKVPENSDLMSFSFLIKKFVEKPDYETAKKYVDQWNYFWNAGIFMFRIDTIKEEFEKYCPEIYKKFNLNRNDFLADFGNMPSISIDYAVMEKTTKSVVVPMNLNRSDLGSRDSVWQNWKKDVDNNVINANIKSKDIHNNLVISNKKNIILDGVDNLLIIENETWLYIGQKGRSQNIKNFM